MCNTVSGLKTFTKAIIDGKPWNKDPLAVRKAWDDEGYSLRDHGGGVRLCFAMMWDNGLVRPSPPIFRAMNETKRALVAAGHIGETRLIVSRRACSNRNVGRDSDRLGERQAHGDIRKRRQLHFCLFYRTNLL